jgi:chemotaxis protein MotB
MTTHEAHHPVEHDEEYEEEQEHEGGESEEPWLVSYADLMTLLFGFFAMLFTYATFGDNENGTVKVNKALAKYFGVSYVAPEKVLADKIRSEAANMPYVRDLDLKVVKNGVEITFITSILFQAGSSELAKYAIEPIRVLIGLIKSTGIDYNVIVEGHTDDSGVGKNSFYPSNWELSAARAGAVVRMFEASGFKTDHLGAVGFGSARPAFPNRDEKGNPIPFNQARNRRVVVKVLLPEDAEPPKELSLPVAKDEGPAPASEKSASDVKATGPGPSPTIDEADQAAKNAAELRGGE